MASKAEVGRVISMLVDAYPQKQFTSLEGFLETATTILGKFTAEQLKAAALARIAESKFFPSLAELREAAETATQAEADAAYKRMLVDTMRWSWRAPVDYLEAVRRWEFMEPSEWTDEDRAEFKRLMGRPVNWATEDPGAPWMALSGALAPNTGGCISPG